MGARLKTIGAIEFAAGDAFRSGTMAIKSSAFQQAIVCEEQQNGR
jgi:hypothetical protein